MKLLCPVAASLFDLNIFLSTFFSDSLDPLNVRDSSIPTSTTGKVTVLYTLIFIFLYSKLQEQRFWTKH